ncbi:uncharacterized protein LOC123011370 [Tribolium madens]|uniref:uncharacterized protein LOC123011370 n=1 Tax=Tribolium madens TaxID=41895 RepID=UPI001CF75ECE|nr:uncharacterized protein LOC123011370 [Tribolium madens]
MIICYKHLLVVDEKLLKTPERTLQTILTGFKITGTVLILILMIQKQTNVVLSLRRLISFDQKVVQMGVSSSHFLHRVFVSSSCFFIIITQICYVLLLYYFLKRNITQIVCYFFSLGYHFIVIAICIIYLDYFSLILGQKLNFVVNLTKKLSQTDRKKALSILVLISGLYTDLYKATKHFNRMISIPILVVTLGDILGGIAILNLMYHNEEDVMDCVSLAIYALQVFTIFLPPMYVKKKSEEITKILLGNKMFDLDAKLEKARAVLLYQILHQPIEMTVCGLFPMSMSALSEQVGLCISIIFFLNQIMEF